MNVCYVSIICLIIHLISVRSVRPGKCFKIVQVFDGCSVAAQISRRLIPIIFVYLTHQFVHYINKNNTSVGDGAGWCTCFAQPWAVYPKQWGFSRPSFICINSYAIEVRIRLFSIVFRSILCIDFFFLYIDLACSQQGFPCECKIELCILCATLHQQQRAYYSCKSLSLFLCFDIRRQLSITCALASLPLCWFTNAVLFGKRFRSTLPFCLCCGKFCLDAVFVHSNEIGRNHGWWM